MRISAVCILLLLASAASAQPAEQSDVPAPLAIGEIQKLLDGYAIVQAQEYLGMTDAQFGPFLPKLRALQDARRRNEQERLRLLQELRRLTNPRSQAQESDIVLESRRQRGLKRGRDLQRQ